MVAAGVSGAVAPRGEFQGQKRSREALLRLGLLAGIAGIVLVALLSLRFGSATLTTRDVWNALFAFDPESYDQTIVRGLRLPRTVVALAVGSALAVAGAVMQGITRNPLADPYVLGVSNGAAAAIVTAVSLLGLTSAHEYLWFAFLGAIGAAALVFLIGSAGVAGPTPVKLALAGVVTSALLGAWTSALLLLDEAAFDTIRFWLAGSVVNRDMSAFGFIAPFLIGGALACVVLGHQLNALGLGDDAARALGMQTGRTRLLCTVLVVIIAGAAVAIAGPIGFVGLAVPHMVRAVVGADYRWVLPYSLVYGAIFLVGADIVGRIVARPSELGVGIVTALVGAPFLVLLARRTTTGA